MEVLVRGSERGRKGWDEEKIQQISKTSSVTWKMELFLYKSKTENMVTLKIKRATSIVVVISQ